MGTNYYLMQRVERCPTCHSNLEGKHETAYHLGKSSGGWNFALHVDPERDIHDLIDIISWCLSDDNYIENEYGDVVELEDFLSVVFRRKNPDRNSLKQNLSSTATPYPFDYVIGEFS